jgi:hypothetical protein
MGGRAYDAFQVEVLRRNNVEAIATFKQRHFVDLVEDLQVLDPSAPG